MFRRTSLLVTGIVFTLLLITVIHISADSTVTATTKRRVNLRVGPGTNFEVVDSLPKDSSVILEQRTPAAYWVLARTPDNRLKGWTSTYLLDFTSGTVYNLPDTN